MHSGYQHIVALLSNIPWELLSYHQGPHWENNAHAQNSKGLCINRQDDLNRYDVL